MVDVPQDNEVSYGGKIFNISGPVRVTNITVPPNPVVFGDSERQGDTQVMTQFTQSAYIGGSGKYRGNTRTDGTRFWRGDLDTAYLDLLTNPPLVNFIGKPAGVTADCDLTIPYRGVQYAAFNDKLYSIGTDLTTYTDVMGVTNPTFPSVPTDAIVWRDKLYVACTTQLDIFDNVLTHTVNAQDGKYFVEWDNKLWTITLESDGWRLYQSTDGVSWSGTAARVTYEAEVTALTVFRDANGASVIAAVAKSGARYGGLWLYDANTPKWYLTEVQWNPLRDDESCHVAHFRDGKMYTNIGQLSMIGIQPGNPMVITPMGLDQDDGVPSDETGKIVAMVGDTNFVIAKIDGAVPTELSGLFWSSDPWSGEDWPSFGGQVAIRRWFGGWHMLYRAAATAAPGKALSLSSAYGNRRLFFSTQAGLYYQDMSDSTYNPRMNPTRQYQEGPLDLETCWWHYGTEGQSKLHGHLFLEVIDCSALNYVQLYLGEDLDDDTWTLLATIQSNGLHEIIPAPEGVPGKWFRYRVRIYRGADEATAAPKVRFYRTETMRRLPATYAFGLQIDLTRPCRGRTPYQQLLELKDFADGRVTPELQLFWYRDDDGTEKQFYATITQMNGTEMPGVRRRGEGSYLVSITAPYRVYDGASIDGVTVHMAP